MGQSSEEGDRQVDQGIEVKESGEASVVEIQYELPEAMALSVSRIILRGEAQKILEEDE